MNAEANGRLIPVGGGDPIPLIRESLTIGRRDSCDIPLRFPNISSKHCALTFHSGYWELADLGSTNGVKVNGNRVQKKVLKPGDRITIGKRDYRIDYNMTADLDEVDETEETGVMGRSLLDKAGLVHGTPFDNDDDEV